MARKRASAARKQPIGLALAGGGPFGAIYEIGALAALQDSVSGLDLNRLDCYVGVSAGGFLAAALANGVPVADIYRLFIAGHRGRGAVTPRLFMRPAYREYWRAALGARIPIGFFDNESIHGYLASAFAQPGRSNDFRRLKCRLYVVATDLDSGESVSFGRPGRDHVPISKAVQASTALPGLFPPVEIDGHHFVDGALQKTLHASEALADGARLVLCVNPIVPYDATRAAGEARGASRLVRGGLPAVLSQTLRAMIHSRMALGLSKYRTQYRGADVLLFQPDAGDAEIFFTNIFSYATRRAVSGHAFARTRADLLARRAELEPALARHGMALDVERLEDPARTLESITAAPRDPLKRAAGELGATLAELRRWATAEGARPAA